MSSPGRKKRKKEPSTTLPSTLIPSMSSPEKKKIKKEPSTTPPSTLAPTLPYDLLLNCIARVSRLYYPTLSLVSKSFRSLIASHELYKVRSLLRHTESCLYLCLDIFVHRNPTWFTLCRKPDQSNNKSSGYVLARVPISNSPYALYAGLVAVGSSIYNIGGASLSTMHKRSHSSVSILDCRSHTWSVAPSLRVKLRSLSASVLDQKIYVEGRYDPNPKLKNDIDIYDDSRCKNSVQVFDTKTQIWDSLPIGTQDTSICYNTASIIYDSLSIDGKFLLVTNKGVIAYDSKQDRWNAAREWTGFDSELGCCVIDNVMYCVFHEGFKWYDTGVRKWRNLEGLVGLPMINRTARRIKLADYGGKMAVLWWGKEDLPIFSDEEIWCAEIALERRNSCEIRGNVEWFDHVLTVHEGFDFLGVLAATV